MVLVNVCKLKFRFYEILACILLTYAVIVILTFTLTAIPVLVPYNEIIGNAIIAGCLIVVAYIKSKDLLVSGYYAFFAMVIAMVGNTFVVILFEHILNTNIYDIRDSIVLAVAMIVLTFPICYVLSRFIGNRLN